ncbi:MAG: TetR/AcrR family transcriptional regulator [Cytophagales bacterium]|nr:TetR/AcrR family transcriptional regulator [Cytophagales bacterium]
MPKSVTFDRNQVMENVMKLFWKKGYNGTSMQDLVDVTGLNRSSFYNSFGDKFSLYEEALGYYQDQQMDALNQFVSGYSSPKEAIISLFKGMTQTPASGPKMGCMVSKCTSELSNVEPRIVPFLKENKDRVLNVFLRLIQEAQSKGEIDAQKDAKTLALYLFANLQGVNITSLLESDLEGVTDQVLESL